MRMSVYLIAITSLLALSILSTDIFKPDHDWKLLKCANTNS